MKMFVIRMTNHPFHLFSCLVATVITFTRYLTITWSYMPRETSHIQAAVFVLNLPAFCTIHDCCPSMWRFRQCNTPLPLSNLAKGKTSLDILTRKLKHYQCPTSKSHFFTNMLVKHKKKAMIASFWARTQAFVVVFWCFTDEPFYCWVGHIGISIAHHFQWTC